MSSRLSLLPSELRILDEEPGRFSFFAWRNLTIAVWLEPPDADAVLRLARVGEVRIKQSETLLSDVHLVLGRLKFPDATTREHLITESRKAAPHLAAVAVLVGGEGFWASAIRSFITGIHVLVPGSFQLRLFGDLAELVAWLPIVNENRTGVPIPSEQLHTVLTRARAHASKRAA